MTKGHSLGRQVNKLLQEKGGKAKEIGRGNICIYRKRERRVGGCSWVGTSQDGIIEGEGGGWCLSAREVKGRKEKKGAGSFDLQEREEKEGEAKREGGRKD